jgi:uncharacterized protein YgbK (DUF1537 family)
LIDVDVEKLLGREPDKEKDRIMEIVKESAGKGEDVIIRSAPSKSFVSVSFETGQKYGLTKTDVSETIALFLGEIARDIIRKVSLNGILLTGGDTAVKTAQALNVSGTIIQDEILPGIPYGYFIEEQFRNIIIVSKAGGFGSEDAISRVLYFLTNGRKK